MSIHRSVMVVAALASLAGAARANMGPVIVDGSDARVSASAQKAPTQGSEIGSTATASILRFLSFPSPPKAMRTPPDAFTRVGALAVCAAKPERGPCKAAIEAYWFDAAAGTCRPFLWGGCGDPPPFRTLEDCERTCRSR